MVYVLRGEATVCARGDRDRVLPIRGDGYESRACGRTGNFLHKGRIDALIGERPYQRPAEPVVANAAKECNVRAEEGRGSGLVGALAAVVGRETGVRDRLTGLGTALHAQDEVLVYGTNDEDVSHSESPLPPTSQVYFE